MEIGNNKQIALEGNQAGVSDHTDVHDVHTELPGLVSSVKIADILKEKPVIKNPSNADSSIKAGSLTLNMLEPSEPTVVEKTAYATSLDSIITSKSGPIWSCVGFKENRLSDGSIKGKIFIFEASKLFQLPSGSTNSQIDEERLEILRKMSPALQNLPMAAQNILREDHYASTYKALGYSCSPNDQGVMELELPDREALLSRWEELQSRQPTLPDLNVISVRGIDAKTFILSSCDGVVLNEEEEFIHDHQSHIWPLIRLLIDSKDDEESKNYLKQKEFWKNEIMKLYNIIERAREAVNDQSYQGDPALQRAMPFFETALSAAVDVLTSIDDYDSKRNVAEGLFIYMKQAWTESEDSDNPYASYFGDKLKEAGLGLNDFGSLWENVKFQTDPKTDGFF